MTENTVPTELPASSKPTKRAKSGGRLPKITPEIVQRVADRRGQGISVRRSVAMEFPRIPFSHWQNTLNKVPVVAALFAEKESAAIAKLLEEMKVGKPGHWQKIAWLLERAFPDEYSTRAGNQVNVTVTTCIGLTDDIAKRAREVLAGQGKPRPVLFSRKLENEAPSHSLVIPVEPRTT